MAGREERYARGVAELMGCLDEQLIQKPRIAWDFETLEAQMTQERRRKSELVLSRRLECLRTVSQAQASLGRFLDRRTSSVQDASCAASDAQGRLNRLQEQSRTVRVNALKRAQAQVADAEQRALQEARARHLLLDRCEAELEKVMKLSGSMQSMTKATSENLAKISRTLEAAEAQASEVMEEKSYIEERRVQLEAREAALPVMEKAWKEVSAKARRESTNKRKLLAMATEHLSKELLKDQRFMQSLKKAINLGPRDALPKATQPKLARPVSARLATGASLPPADESPSVESKEVASADSTVDEVSGEAAEASPKEEISVGSPTKEEFIRQPSELLQDDGPVLKKVLEPKKVVRSITAPPRRLNRWPQAATGAPVATQSRVLVQTIPSARMAESSPLRRQEVPGQRHIMQPFTPEPMRYSSVPHEASPLRGTQGTQSPVRGMGSIEPPSTPQMPIRPQYPYSPPPVLSPATMPPMMPAMPTNVVTVSPGRLPSQAFTMGPYTVPRYPQTVISPAHRTVVYTLQR